MNYSFVYFTIVVFLGLAACASQPTHNQELERARQVMAQVEQEPGAGSHAVEEIERAHVALRRAEELARDGASQKEINHSAYLARRHAEIAKEQIAAANYKEIVAQGEDEREKVLLQARAQKSAELAERNAVFANEQAQKANQAAGQLELARQQLLEMNARETSNGMVLTLGDVLFDTGKSVLKPGAEATLDRLSGFMEKFSNTSVLIEGYTDSMGSDEFNLELSRQRAESVRSALISRGVEAGRVVALGKGESAPVASNSTAAGRQQNRRVEIVIQNASSAG